MADPLVDVFDVQIQFPLDLRTVKPDVNGRDAIGTLQRFEGLAVWTVAEQKLWRLIGGISNTNWVDQTPIGNGLQAVTVSGASPSGGNPGDIHFKNITGGTEVWYNNDGTWGVVGTIGGSSGGLTTTLNDSLDFSTTSSALDTAYPSANPGDIVYSETNSLMWTKLDAGKWTSTNLNIV